MCCFAPFLQGGGILTSCNKNQDPIKETFVTKDNYENLNQEIARFKTSMLDTRKSGSVMELNEAVWMMEATFNYYHGFTGEDYLETLTDSTFIPINYSGFDEVPMDELQQLYKQVNNAIVSSFENYPVENKKPFVFDLELQGTTTGSQLLVMTTVGSINTQKSTKSVNTINPFGATDYWYPGADLNTIEWYQMGKCGIYSGDEYGESSALLEIKSATLEYIRLQFGGGYYFADVETIIHSVLPNEYPGKIYEGAFNECLSPNDMNNYFHGLEFIIDDLKPDGKTYVTITALSYPLLGDGSLIYHGWENPKYGVKTEREQLPEEPIGF